MSIDDFTNPEAIAKLTELDAFWRPDIKYALSRNNTKEPGPYMRKHRFNRGVARAIVIADSISPAGRRVTTLEVTLPRCILAEFTMHRAFARNSASSRAVPVKKMIERVLAEPYVPYFTKNQKGMQGTEYLPEETQAAAEDLWMESLHQAIEKVNALNALDPAGLHKEHVNRLLEPFQMHVVLVTATDWTQFLILRDSPQAHPAFRDTAERMRLALENSVPVQRSVHLPLLEPEEAAAMDLGTAMRISAGRCARVSYLTHHGTRDSVADLDLAQRLIDDRHWSPLEHPCTAIDDPDQYIGPFRGWRQFRKQFADENIL